MDDIDSDQHIMVLSTRDVMMGLITNDSLGGKSEVKLIDECLYLALLL